VKSPLIFSAVFAAAVLGACSSTDPTNPSTSIPRGSVAQGGACTQTVDCEKGLTCGFPMADQCKATGVCIALAPCSNATLCPCDGGDAYTACVDSLFAPTPVTGDESCVKAGKDASSPPSPPPAEQDSGATPNPPPSDTDSGSPSDQDSGQPAPVDAGNDTGNPPPVDAGHDSGSSGHDAGHGGNDAGQDAGSTACPGYAPPGTPGPCVCSSTSCDVNGCFNGYYCRLSDGKCKTKPSSC
jgi:hypothetical protein